MSIGGLLGLEDAAEKLFKVYDYFNNWDRIDSYDPNAEVYYRDGKYFKALYEIDPDNQEETVRRLVELSYDEYQLQYAYVQELENRKPEEMIKNFLRDFENRNGEMGTSRQEISIQLSGAMRQPSFGFIDKTKILKNQAEEMSAALRKKIRDFTATNYEGGMGDTADDAARMRKQSEEIAAAGIDTTELDQQITQYESAAKNKIVESWRRAWTQLKTDTKAAQAEITDDTAAFADTQYDAAISRLDQERTEREKAVMQDQNDLVAKAAVETWYTAQVELEQQKRDARYTEDQLNRYRSSVEHNTLLLDLENKTQAEIDLLNERELKSEVYYLDEKLKDAGLARDKRLALEKEKSSAIKELNEIASRDMTMALDLHMRELEKHSTNWKSVYDGAFLTIDSSVQGHFNNMIVGTESFSKGMVGIIDTMSNEIRKIWIKMWYEQSIMKPLHNWMYELFGGKAPGKDEGKNQKEDNSKEAKKASRSGGSDFCVGLGKNLIPQGSWGTGVNYDEYHGNFNFDTTKSIKTMRFARDEYTENGLVILGKESSESTFLENDESIYNIDNSEKVPSLNSQKKLPNIIVNLTNRTGTEANATSSSKFDDLGNMIIQIVVDAIPQNRGGIQDMIKAAGVR